MMYRLLCALLLTIVCGAAAHAAQPALCSKPLVFCADASPATQLEPQLATAWQISPDAKTFTFTLRRGVRFHTTAYGPKTPFNRAFPAAFIYPQSLGLAQMIESIDKLDSDTVFKRERPWMTMAHSAVYIPIRKDVKGFVMAPNGSVDFESV